MKIQFDPKQQYQLDAVNAVVELFDYSVIFQTMDTELFAAQVRTQLGVGNRLLLDETKLLENLRAPEDSDLSPL